MVDPAAPTVVRDGLDWVVDIATLVASLIAILLFLPWALERRRRPEISFMWRVSESGQVDDLRDWPLEEIVEIRPGQTILVLAGFQNVGDRAGGPTTLTNFVVPDLFELCIDGSPTAKAMPTKNETAGTLPHHRAVYFGPAAPFWAPGDWFATHYSLTAPSTTTHAVPVRIMHSVSNEDFNRTGWRWIPSIVPPREPLTADSQQPWPPLGQRVSWIKSIRWVIADPFDRANCTRGSREDVRDLRILPNAEPASTADPKLK